MTDKTPADWILIEAAKRSAWTGHSMDHLRDVWRNPLLYLVGNSYRALCDMIEKYEQPPVDRKLLCAREAMAQACALPESEVAYRRGTWDHAGALKQCLRAIELWEEGFGK